MDVGYLISVYDEGIDFGCVFCSYDFSVFQDEEAIYVVDEFTCVKDAAFCCLNCNFFSEKHREGTLFFVFKLVVSGVCFLRSVFVGSSFVFFFSFFSYYHKVGG